MIPRFRRLNLRRSPRKIFQIVLTLLVLSGVSACETGPDKRERARHFVLAAVDPLPEDRNLHADHYPSSNERRIDLFAPHIQNLGGGYIGVGTDQNFTFIAWAKSEYAWLMDFDYVSVDVNRIHMFFIRQAPGYAEYRELWDRKNRTSSFKLLEDRFGAEPDFYRIRNAWKVAHRNWNDVPERLRELDMMSKRFGLSTFSNNPADYTYIRTMILENRIQAVPGDLKGGVTMQNIAVSARRMEMPIRLVYTSNAEEYMRFPDGMKANMLALPSDAKSLIIRTTTTGTRSVLGYPEGEKFPDDFPFHYNMQPLLVYQAWMRKDGEFRVLDMIKHNRKLEQGLSIQEQTPGQLETAGKQ